MCLETAKERVLNALEVADKFGSCNVPLQGLLHAMPAEWKFLPYSQRGVQFTKAMADLVVQAAFELLREGKIELTANSAANGPIGPWDFCVQLKK